MKTILVTGRNGQVGWELARTLMPVGHVVAWGRDDADLGDAGALRTAVAALRPDIIVNAAAYTAVDRAESEPELAKRINADAPAVLAEEARRAGALLVHFSTDYVFDGTKAGAYTEDDPPKPINAYGSSKLAGEVAIRDVAPDYLILRVSWVYAARGANFLRTILRLAREREQLRVVADQYGAPTWARFIAEATSHVVARALEERRRGVFSSDLFHLAAAGETSWHGFAETLLQEAARIPQTTPIRTTSILPIGTADYPLPAPRPRNSCMSTEHIQTRYGLALPPWQTGVRLCLEELAGNGMPVQ